MNTKTKSHLNKSLKRNKSSWDHKIVRVFDRDLEPDNDFFEERSERTDHIFLDDLQNENDELMFRGWRFNFGFSIDKNSFSLFYKKPRLNKKDD